MGERKVLQHYYPADFDPQKLPRPNKPRDGLQSEEIKDDDYLGIKKVRLYLKCTNCAAVITIKTDPQYADYTVESGAVRGFEPWRSDPQELVEVQQDVGEPDRFQELERKQDVLKAQMDALDALDLTTAISLKREKLLTSARNSHELVDRLLESKKRKREEEGDDIVCTGEKEGLIRLPDDEDAVAKEFIPLLGMSTRDEGRKKEEAVTTDEKPKKKSRKRLQDLCPAKPLVPYGQ